MARALTVRAIDAAKPHPKEALEIPDGTVTGLYLVVQPSGAKSWAVRYRHRRRPAKADARAIPAARAGRRPHSAQETLRIVSEGNDPTADRVTMARLKRLPAAEQCRTFEAVKRPLHRRAEGQGPPLGRRAEGASRQGRDRILEAAPDRGHHRRRRCRADRGHGRRAAAGRMRRGSGPRFRSCSPMP